MCEAKLRTRRLIADMHPIQTNIFLMLQRSAVLLRSHVAAVTWGVPGLLWLQKEFRLLFMHNCLHFLERRLDCELKNRWIASDGPTKDSRWVW